MVETYEDNIPTLVSVHCMAISAQQGT